MWFGFRLLLLLILPLGLLGCGAESAGPVTSVETAAPEEATTSTGSTSSNNGSTSLTTGATEPETSDTSNTTDPPATSNTEPSELASTVSYETLPPGSVLPDEAGCAAEVSARSSAERRPENTEANGVALDVEVDIDGADEVWNARLAPRITGDFTGTTDQILRWAACKWGFDEDITRARAVTESSWRVTTEGDDSDDPAECAIIGLDAPCAQSYGLLQVKGTVHVGTYPATTRSTAFGVDYAMAWLRSCYEGSFVWLGDDYGAGDEYGCIGTWFSGNWWDQLANDYAGEVRFHLAERTWEGYQP